MLASSFGGGDVSDHHSLAVSYKNRQFSIFGDFQQKSIFSDFLSNFFGF